MKKTHRRNLMRYALRNLPDYLLSNELVQMIKHGVVSRAQVFGFHPTKKRTKSRIKEEKRIKAHREELYKQSIVEETNA